MTGNMLAVMCLGGLASAVYAMARGRHEVAWFLCGAVLPGVSLLVLRALSDRDRA